MTASKNLTAMMTEAVAQVQQESFRIREVYSDSGAPKGKNEFLFFVKPEITMPSNSIRLERILDLIQDKISAFGFTVHNVKVLSASYLEQYNIIAQHYGVINKIASNAVKNMSQGAREKFEEIFGEKVDSVKVLGGMEFLAQYPDFNANSVDFLLQNVEAKKLAGGTYCAPIKMDNETVYLVNGFHPRQLKQFTERGRSIIVMTLSSDSSWKEARTEFIGATNPAAAADGSLRKTFFVNKEALGLAEVSQGMNGVHLSAGPVEALVELKRYNTDFSSGVEMNYTDFSFGKELSKVFTEEEIAQIADNVNVLVNGRETSVFDLTEEMDSDEAINVLRSAFKK